MAFNVWLAIFTTVATFVVVIACGMYSLGGKGILLVVPTSVAFIPAGIFIYFWYWKKEVRHYLPAERVGKFYLGNIYLSHPWMLTFVAGVVAVLPVIVIELAISSLFAVFITKNVEDKISDVLWLVISDFFTSFVVASLCEEGEKLVFALAVKVDEKDTPYSVLVLCVAATLGMATLETVGYIFSVAITEGLEDSFITSILRAILAIPLHASTATLIGAAIGRKKFHLDNASYPRIMLLPLMLHGAYDFGTIFGAALYSQSRTVLGLSLIGMVVVIDGIAVTLAYRQVKQLDAHSHSDYSLLPTQDPNNLQ